MSDNNLHLNCLYPEESKDLTRISVPLYFTYKQLQARLCQEYRKPVSFEYVDEENDLITVRSQADMEELVSLYEYIKSMQEGNEIQPLIVYVRSNSCGLTVNGNNNIINNDIHGNDNYTHENYVHDNFNHIHDTVNYNNDNSINGDYNGNDADVFQSKSAVPARKNKFNLKVHVEPDMMETEKLEEDMIDRFFKNAVSNNGAIKFSELCFGELLGRGAYGIVRKATHIPSSIDIAVKEIPLDFAEHEKNRVQTELKILLQCKSKYIVDFYGVCFENSHIYLCMEFMDVGCLGSLLQKVKTIAEDVLVHIIHSVLSGLVYLVDFFRIIHRDIKPQNVLVNTNGQYKLCDFGVSAELQRSIAATFIGTGLYMAPERIMGRGSSKRSDVWSLGIMIVELATGIPPYGVRELTNISEFELMDKIVRAEPPKLQLMPNPPTLLFTQFVNACLIKEESQRPTPHQLLEFPLLTQRDYNLDIVKWTKKAVYNS